MCASCAQNYYRLSNHCTECPQYNKFLFILAPILTFLLILAVLIAPISAKFVEFSKWAIALNMLQFVALTGTLQANWPASINAIMNYLTAVNFNIEIFNLDCVEPMTFYRKQIICMAAPTAMLFMLSSIYVGCAVIKAYHRYQARKEHTAPSSSNVPLCYAYECHTPCIKGSSSHLSPQDVSSSPCASSADSAVLEEDMEYDDAWSHASGNTSTGSADISTTALSKLTNQLSSSAVAKAHSRPKPTGAKSILDVLQRRSLRACIIVYVVSYIFLCKHVLQLFNCEKVEQLNLLVVDMRLDCDSPEYRMLLVPAVVGLVFYVLGVYVIFALVAYQVNGRQSEVSMICKY
jgi:hypothetical protein